jgi:hypothetical protein
VWLLCRVVVMLWTCHLPVDIEPFVITALSQNLLGACASSAATEADFPLLRLRNSDSGAKIQQRLCHCTPPKAKATDTPGPVIALAPFAVSFPRWPDPADAKLKTTFVALEVVPAPFFPSRRSTIDAMPLGWVCSRFLMAQGGRRCLSTAPLPLRLK